MRRSHRLVAPAMLAALLLSGCVPSDPTPTPPPTPDATPVFASEEEALAAAEEAYGKYLETVAVVMADGGAKPERLRPLLTEELFEQESAGYEEFASNGWRGVGSTTFTMQLQRADLAAGGVVAYVCDDRSGLDIVDAEGRSVVLGDRPDLAASVVEFVWHDSLVLSSQEAWDGGGVC
ncbi:hypothetical protein H4J02_05275 [Protaetiibacter sp. SSC-01]|uniref:hypothetical protein n=1 Tax=Protaetiibacter sp. SSC-01 TaxID=2759943 RepID=UPI0016572A12|nr:hypothetical protein [Protaetiibacter sp. SSC-01]QNO38421.1 hypothetical protein H4J02_05275 [Protaetiibacter sp. SSC-01]